jgi:hypothetical protein
MSTGRHILMWMLLPGNWSIACNRILVCGHVHNPSLDLPTIVLGIQQEVGAHNGHTNSHYHQNDKHQEHKAINVVDLVSPE